MGITTIDSDALIEKLHAGVIVHAPDTRVLYANPAALKILRMSEAQVKGKKDALDPQWHLLDSLGVKMPVEQYPVNQVIATGKAVVNIELGICDSSTQQVTWALCTA